MGHRLPSFVRPDAVVWVTWDRGIGWYPAVVQYGDPPPCRVLVRVFNNPLHHHLFFYGSIADYAHDLTHLRLNPPPELRPAVHEANRYIRIFGLPEQKKALESRSNHVHGLVSSPSLAQLSNGMNTLPQSNNTMTGIPLRLPYRRNASMLREFDDTVTPIVAHEASSTSKNYSAAMESLPANTRSSSNNILPERRTSGNLPWLGGIANKDIYMMEKRQRMVKFLSPNVKVANINTANVKLGTAGVHENDFRGNNMENNRSASPNYSEITPRAKTTRVSPIVTPLPSIQRAENGVHAENIPSAPDSSQELSTAITGRKRTYEETEAMDVKSGFTDTLQKILADFRSRTESALAIPSTLLTARRELEFAQAENKQAITQHQKLVLRCEELYARNEARSEQLAALRKKKQELERTITDNDGKVEEQNLKLRGNAKKLIDAAKSCRYP